MISAGAEDGRSGEPETMLECLPFAEGFRDGDLGYRHGLEVLNFDW